MELVKLYKKLKVATNLMNCGREYCGRVFVMMNCGENGQDFNGIIKKVMPATGYVGIILK